MMLTLTSFYMDTWSKNRLFTSSHCQRRSGERDDPYMYVPRSYVPWSLFCSCKEAQTISPLDQIPDLFNNPLSGNAPRCTLLYYFTHYKVAMRPTLSLYSVILKRHTILLVRGRVLPLNGLPDRPLVIYCA